MAGPPASKDSVTFAGVVATLGAAAGAGAFLILIDPKWTTYAIVLAVTVLVVGLGLVGNL